MGMVAVHMMYWWTFITLFEQVNWNILGLSALALRKNSAFLLGPHCLLTEKIQKLLPVGKATHCRGRKIVETHPE